MFFVIVITQCTCMQDKQEIMFVSKGTYVVHVCQETNNFTALNISWFIILLLFYMNKHNILMSIAFIVVKRGYHKLSLKVHPDRVHGDGKKTATEKFQVLGKIYCILSDKDKRAVYDETGEVQNVNNYV